MGIYIFRARKKFIKVGHHKVTQRRPNVWYRVARRGFGSCVSPAETRGRLSISDLTLLRWYPNLDITHERAFHKHWRGKQGHVCGEWYHYSYFPEIRGQIEGRMKGVSTPVNPEDKQKAITWGTSRGARTIRKRSTRKRSTRKRSTRKRTTRKRTQITGDT